MLSYELCIYSFVNLTHVTLAITLLTFGFETLVETESTMAHVWRIGGSVSYLKLEQPTDCKTWSS